MTLYGIEKLLARQFKDEWTPLTPAERVLVADDFALLLHDEYDVDADHPDNSMAWNVEVENAVDAAREYARRIGRNNLAAYVKCLAVPNRAHWHGGTFGGR